MLPPSRAYQRWRPPAGGSRGVDPSSRQRRPRRMRTFVVAEQRWWCLVVVDDKRLDGVRRSLTSCLAPLRVFE